MAAKQSLAERWTRMSKNATLAQGIKVLAVLDELTCAQFQTLLGSGILADCIEAAQTVENLNDLDGKRDAVRIALGLEPLEVPKPTPLPKALLIPVGTAVVDATDEPIILSPEVLRERYNIKWPGDNFGEWFMDGTIAPFGGSTLAYKKLARRSVDGPIITELGGALAARTEPVEMLRLIEAQKHGESGPLLTNGYANIFYWEDKIRFPEDERVAYTNEAGEKVVLRAVGAGWDAHGGGWHVGAGSVLGPRGWRGGRQVFSRDSR